MTDKYTIDISIDDDSEEELKFFDENGCLCDLSEILKNPHADLIITTLIFDAYSMGQDVVAIQEVINGK